MDDKTVSSTTMTSTTQTTRQSTQSKGGAGGGGLSAEEMDYEIEDRSAAPAATFIRQAREVRQPHNRSYVWVGVAVVAVLGSAVALGFLGFSGPKVFNQNVNWLIAMCIGALGLGCLYLLFTIRRAMRKIRQQSLSIVRLESRFRHFRPAPAPRVRHAVPTVSFIESFPVTETVAMPTIPKPKVVQPSHVMPRTARPVRPSRPVNVIEGIGPKFSRRLGHVGVKTLDDLRRADEETVLHAAKPLAPAAAYQWKAMADLMILNGVDAQAAELLVRAGYDSISHLAECEPAQLHKALVHFNNVNETRIYPGVLHLADVEKWVKAARTGNRRDRAPGAIFAYHGTNRVRA